MKNLKKLRESRGLSQQKLASKFSLSQQSIYKYENSLAEPDLETLTKMADFFDVSVDYLIGNADEPEVHSSKGNSLTPHELKHLKAYRKLSPNRKDLIDQIIRSYEQKD